MGTNTKGVESTQQEEITCPHHWLIDPPNGEFSTGKCKMCKETKQFRNSSIYNGWNGALKRAKAGTGHGLTKTQLIKKLAAEGKTLPDNPRIYEKEKR